MYRYWQQQLESSGHDFIPVSQMGYGSFESQVERALTQITPGSHLLGHSMGGLVARGVAARLPVRSVLTIGTPHLGTSATEGALDLAKQSPAFYRLLSLFGYDVELRREPLSHFTIEKIAEWSSKHPPLPNVANVSFIGAATRARLAPPFQVIYSKIHSRGELSDGLILAESQRWAEVAGEFELDHFSQLGAFLHVTPSERRRARAEFARLVEAVKTVINRASE